MRNEIARSPAHRARRLLGAAGVLAAIVVLALPAWASRVVQVRVGDHPGYTRIVFELDQSAGYRIERVSEGSTETLVVTLAAGSNERTIRTRSKDIEKVVVHPGAEAVAHIELTESGLRLQEMILANPPRIVLDVMKSETALAAAKPKPRPQRVEPAPQPVVEPAPVEPEPVIAEIPPPPQPVEPEPVAPPEPVVAVEPAPPVEIIEIEEPAPPVEIIEIEEPAPPVEIVEIEEPSPPIEVFEPEPAPLPPIAVVEPEPVPVEPAPEVVEIEVSESAVDAEIPGGLVVEPIEPIELAEMPSPVPSPAMGETEPLPPWDEPSPPGALSDPTLLAAVGAALLGVVALVFVARRRRKLPKDLEVSETADGVDSGAATDDTAEMGEAGLEDAHGLFDEDEVAATPSARPAAAPETATPPAQRGGSIFDDDDDDAGPEPAKGEPSMDQQVSDLPAQRAASPPPAPAAASVGGDVAAILAELQRKVGQLESKLEEQVDARERLERQVAAQSEELRVQRAAIARTQRALRSMSRTDEDKATEPALRDTDTQVKTRVNG